jgi:hypothetical protein
MNKKINGSFTVVENENFKHIQSDSIYPTINMEIDSTASVTDMLDAFKSFLLSLGYVISSDEEIVIQDNRVDTDDYYLINEKIESRG